MRRYVVNDPLLQNTVVPNLKFVFFFVLAFKQGDQSRPLDN